MKILILNGSARNGNCAAAVKAFTEGIGPEHEFEVLNTSFLKIGPCMGCEACKTRKGCIAEDDTNATIEKVVNADMLVFVSPVYWWGISAQLKSVMDKFYSRGSELGGKKIGAVIVGGSPVDAEQYQLIRRLFICISDYLKWTLVFHKDYYAWQPDELAKNREALSELKALGEEL